MIICSQSVQNVLDRLYVTAVMMGKQPVEYNRCIEALRSVESGIIRTVAQKPLSWARARLFVAKSGRYWFGYVMQNNVVIVDEVFDCVRNTIIDESTNRRTITIKESELRMMIQECVKSIIYESYSKRRIGKYDVVEGDNQPHSLKGLEQYGNNLYDVRLYSEVNDKKETYAVFSIGKDTSRYICCHLETDEEYGSWLGFTPLEKQNVPALIKQDLKDNPINR